MCYNIVLIKKDINMLSTQLKVIKNQNYILIVDLINKSSTSKRTVEIFENQNLAGCDGELSNITFNVFNKYIETYKKLPKFWSFKNGQLNYKIGIFCFNQEKFRDELNIILTNFCNK